MVKACPKCGYVNNGVDAKCANCDQSLAETETVVKRRRFRFNLSLQKIILLIFALTILFFFVWGGGNPKEYSGDETMRRVMADASWQKEDYSALAYIIACDFVREKCRAPGTALFPPQNDALVRVSHLYGTSYKILGYVDSANSYGSMIRDFYSGEVRLITPGNWKLVDLKMGNWETMEGAFAE